MFDGINTMLDSIIGPLNIAAEYVNRISQGDIPAKITDPYNGDFNEIKSNLNTCIDAINLLIADAAMLTKAAVEGRLDIRADESRHLEILEESYMVSMKRLMQLLNRCMKQCECLPSMHQEISPLGLMRDFM
jgi:methyl-accepting chemotaxis protein